MEGNISRFGTHRRGIPAKLDDIASLRNALNLDNLALNAAFTLSEGRQVFQHTSFPVTN